MIEYFISSTFSDMQAERDALHNYVLPEIKRYANEHGEDIGFIDLRWGINADNKNSDENMAKVLSVCLQDIDRCRPQMIILLGDRYGSVPSVETLHNFIKCSAAGFYSETDLQNKSITEIEITHGVFRQQDICDNVTICIRESLDYPNLPQAAQEIYGSSTEADNEKLQKLKNTLISTYPDNVLFYSVSWDEDNQCICGLDSFVEQITQRLLCNIGHIVRPDPLCEEEKHRNLQSAYFTSVQNRFCGRENVIERVHGFTADKEQNLFLLRGNCGMGKSYLCAKIAELYSDKYCVLPVLISHGGNRLSALQFLKQVVWLAESLRGEKEHFNTHAHTYEEWKIEARRLLQDISEEKAVLLVVDDIDKLYPDEHKDVWDYLPFYDNAQVKILVTAQSGYKLPTNVSVNYRTAFSELSELEDAESREMLSRRLEVLHKELPTYVIDQLLRAARYRSPYYLDIILHKITHLSESDYTNINKQFIHNLDANDNLYRYISNIVAETPAAEKAALKSCLDKAFKIFPEAQAERLFRWIRCTSHGLRLDDLYHLFEGHISAVDLSRFLHLTSIILQSDEMGRIYFCNSIAENAADEYLESDGYDDTAAQTELLRYMVDLPNSDFIKLQEFAPLCLLCGCPETAARYISQTYLMEAGNDFSDPKYAKIISSIRNIVQHPKYEKIDLCAFLMEMTEISTYFSHEECYGFISAILFSYDILFDSFSDKEKETVMLKLHDLAVTKLYPCYSCNIEYLRTVYVCCEQSGIRSTDFLYERKMYKEFLQYCLEMLERIPKDYRYQNYIFHDLSIAYEKNASLNYQSHTGNAMKFFDNSVRYAEMITPSAPYYDNLKTRKYAALLSRASAVIEFEMILKNNHSAFWDKERLCMVIQDLPAIRDYYETAPRSLSTKRNLQETYFLLANGSFCFDDFENEYQNLWAMYNISKEICAESDSVLDLDRVRMSLMRLGSCKNSNISFEKKTQWLAESVDCIKTILTVSSNYSKNSLKILFFATDRYLKYCWKHIDQQDKEITNAILLKKDASFEIKKIAALISDIQKRLQVENIKLILLAPVEEDLDDFHELFMKFLPMAKKYQDYMRVLSVQAYQRKDYKTAIENGELCLKMCQLQKGFINKDILLSNRLDIYHLLYVCYHNWSNNLSDTDFKKRYPLEYDRLWDMRSYYTQMIINDCTLYDCLFPENTDTQTYKNVPVFQYADEDGLHHAIALTNLLCYAIDSPDENAECGLFWEAVEKRSYYINGQKYHYSHFEITEHDSHRQVDNYFSILPQKMIEKAGRYLCEHIGEERVLKLLYLSDWFECIALEYAYRHDMPDIAKKIIENGYDRYLELPLLYILRKYDRTEYDNQMKKLKLICHIHNTGIIKKRSRYIIAKYKFDSFYAEYAESAKRIIGESKFWSEDDPRYRSYRSNIIFDS